MLARLLEENRDNIIKVWVKRLKTEVSPKYSVLPVENLFKTITRVADANFYAITKNDFKPLDDAIQWIAKMRSRSGFSLTEIQKAFELYRTILIDFFNTKLEPKEIVHAIKKVNDILAHTIHRFSDYYQALHNAEINEYAKTLEKKVAERTKQLAESEKKYRVLVEKIRDGYFVNQDGKIVFANKAFCKMHGYTKKEVIGKEYIEFVSPKSIEEVKNIYYDRITKGVSKQQYVYYRLTKRGEFLPTENTVTLANYEGRIAAIGISRDITERVEMEKRMREAESLAHIGHLTTSLAHEIRNPLSSAKMSIQMILKNNDIHGTDRRRLEILSQQVLRLDRIVTEMLDFAKPIKFEFKENYLPDLIDNCLEVIDARIKEKEIMIKKFYSRDLPCVMIDREKMEQAIINLLLNSVDAVNIKGRIWISIKEMKRKKTVRLLIKDNGCGVDKNDLPYIFDPYFSKKPKGTGLGLANAKRIIESHKAIIDAYPGKNSGMCFIITFPVIAKIKKGKLKSQ
ncbi:MAG TPA: PAS domain S-box protein [Syntrophorhabdaceae bacterium]|nr:PAS domain S-box protein [Syntrophorhabdaceae bacterium]